MPQITNNGFITNSSRIQKLSMIVNACNKNSKVGLFHITKKGSVTNKITITDKIQILYIQSQKKKKSLKQSIVKDFTVETFWKINSYYILCKIKIFVTKEFVIYMGKRTNWNVK